MQFLANIKSKNFCFYLNKNYDLKIQNYALCCAFAKQFSHKFVNFHFLANFTA